MVWERKQGVTLCYIAIKKTIRIYVNFKICVFFQCKIYINAHLNGLLHNFYSLHSDKVIDQWKTYSWVTTTDYAQASLHCKVQGANILWRWHYEVHTYCFVELGMWVSSLITHWWPYVILAAVKVVLLGVTEL
jgi:hypothetical protein